MNINVQYDSYKTTITFEGTRLGDVEIELTDSEVDDLIFDLQRALRRKTRDREAYY